MIKKAPLFWGVLGVLLLLLAGQGFFHGRQFSEMENRVLSGPPDISLSAVTSDRWGDRFESFAADQLPFRDGFVSLYTALEAAEGHRLVGGVVLGKDGRMFDRTDAYSKSNVLLNAKALETISRDAGVPVYLLAVPTAAAVYPEAVPALSPVADDEALLNAAAENTRLVPLLDALREAKGDAPLFYLTDHHWTLDGAYVGYQAACEALGLMPLPLENTEGPLPFYGSFYSRCPLLWQKADDFSWMLPEGVRLIAEEEEKEGLVDREGLKLRDRYAALLYGNHGTMEMINDAVAEGTLFVIKDSYANILLPLLARHYHRVVAIDPRYFSGSAAEAVINCKGEAILCISGISSLASSRALALLD